MAIAQAYAELNHRAIHRLFGKVLNELGYTNFVCETWMSTHNYIDLEDRIIRKGAIKAQKGTRMVVPFNMRDGIALCIGKGNDEWNCSCSHGSGRKMSRADAKNAVTLEDFKKSMEGIYTTTVCEQTLDESPMAYKDTDEIIRLIDDTCRIVDFVKPIINIKAVD
jgi:RNA-splicing ligase RtcB